MTSSLRLLAGLGSSLLLALAACGGTVTAGTGGAGGSAASSSSSSASSSSTSSSSSASSSSSTGSASTSSSSSSTGSFACAPTSMSTLGGVHMEIDAPPCAFSLSDPMATITFSYRVVVDADVPGVVPEPQDAGGCDQPGPSGLIVFEKVGGNGQNYCLCDTGLCVPPSQSPVTLTAGTYPGTFTWDKHNWNGPSDTGNPEGAVFPVGDYSVVVSAIGKMTTPGGSMDFTVSATLPIQITP